jgi:hypothetical protein
MMGSFLAIIAPGIFSGRYSDGLIIGKSDIAGMGRKDP